MSTPRKPAVLLNYTTKIDADRTIGEIMGILRRHGADRIQVVYDQQWPSGIMFGIRAGEHDLGFRLPANVTAVYDTLMRQRSRGEIRIVVTREHAARVAWRILKDWVEAQIALIETGMVRTEEVFLPYMLDSAGERTMFQLMQGRGFLALPAPE